MRVRMALAAGQLAVDGQSPMVPPKFLCFPDGRHPESVVDIGGEVGQILHSFSVSLRQNQPSVRLRRIDVLNEEIWGERRVELAFEAEIALRVRQKSLGHRMVAGAARLVVRREHDCRGL